MHSYLCATLDFLNDTIPHKDWFIAGGAALSYNFNDIDVFFTSREAYDIAVSRIPSFTYTTSNANTFRFNTYYYSYSTQFICRSFGDHITIVEGFDLNASRRVIFPDGTRYNHPTCRLPLYFTKESINKDTLMRFAKYVYQKEIVPSPSVIPLITELLLNDTYVTTDYYDNTDRFITLSPIAQLRNFNMSLRLLDIAYAAISALPADLRLKRSAYLFTCWSNRRPPLPDSVPTELLHSYSTIYNLPPHQRVIDENPEYLL